MKDHAVKIKFISIIEVGRNKIVKLIMQTYKKHNHI